MAKYYIHFRDETADCNFEPGTVPEDFKVIAAYLYKAGERTYCCSLSPSSYVVQVAQFFAPPNYEAWDAWRNESNEQDELLDEIENRFDYAGYFPLLEARDGIKTSISSRLDWEAAEQAMREAESSNGEIAALYSEWLKRGKVAA